MAQLPNRSCPYPGCHEITRGGRCEAHAAQQGREQRDNRFNDPFYNSVLWKRTRRAYRKAHPLCEDCLERGLTEAAQMVHHIKPIRDGGAKTAWRNLRSECFACHGKYREG